MDDSLEARVDRLEKALGDQQSLNIKLLNRELALRALAYSLLDQAPLDRRRSLAESYERYLVTTAEQLPPEYQHPEILEEFADALRRTSG